MPLNSTTMQLPPPSTPQPQSQQMAVQQPPRAASVPETHSQPPSTPQAQNQLQALASQQQLSMQSQTNTKPLQSAVVQVEDSNEEVKPLISLPQENSAISTNQNDTNQSATPVSSVSDQGSNQTGGKVFSYASQKSASENNFNEKMDVDSEDKSAIERTDTINESKSVVKTEVKEEKESDPENGKLVASSSIKKEPVIKEEPSTPQSSVNSSESNSETKPDSSSETSQGTAKHKPNKKSKVYFFNSCIRLC